ncbi:hypothetical protein HY373_01715 [Candidatus Berkelbacteria bacterium]|nr:hypothetical protein [Candidatus Berkelbacteria bacterium]
MEIKEQREKFLLSRAFHLISKKLPLRQQKKRLLERLGFPIEVLPVMRLPLNSAYFGRMIADYWKSGEFLIITSPHPHPHSPPLIRFTNDRKVMLRWEQKWRQIKPEEVSVVLNGLNGMVEFAKPIWGPDTYACRLIYVSHLEQILELQIGVTPNELGEQRNIYPYLAIELSYFDPYFVVETNPERPFNKREVGVKIHSAGFSVNIIETIAGGMAEWQDSFEILKKIGKLPTIEFAYKISSGFTVIDIDWPEEYAWS